jgi:dipeptidyl aminopeptidase/acylaminoacyl peptidase
LERADVSRLLASGWRWPEPFRAKGRDGKIDIWGVIFRPSHLAGRRKYPVIESIYAGPQSSFAPKTFSAQHGLQAIAELGFIVVQMDGMGTGNRSKAFHNVAYKNLGDSGFPDRIAWMKAAATKYPYLDLKRVGVFGMSAGGYNAAHALIARPDFYKVAVAMSGNHDHRTDKVWWNELWMGYPVGPHYARQSNIVNAGKLKGHLLLVHGELDDNVNPYASTMQFVNALIKANKDFDLLLVPGSGHGFGTYVQRRMWDYFVRHLQLIEPPAGYELKGPADSSVNVIVRNRLRKPVTIYWVGGGGGMTRYKDVPPGRSVTQHTFIGHEWQAQLDGLPVSTYTASAESPEWTIESENR